MTNTWEKFTPSNIVAQLDRYIIGQTEAKRAVAIALRNRLRRRKLPPEIAKEIAPKNIMMVGPTGVGKTEIARRLAQLVDAPFVKVEATKFTEVGYVGRDVESMIRELVEISVQMVKSKKVEEVQEKAEKLAEERILNYLIPKRKRKGPDLNTMFMQLLGTKTTPAEEVTDEENEADLKILRENLREALRKGELDEQEIEIETVDRANPKIEVFTMAGIEDIGINIQDLFDGILPKKMKKKRVKVKEAKLILKAEEAEKLIDMDKVIKEALEKAQEDGIIFIDELDKIVATGTGSGPDVSREGVQRDLLPVVEGCTVPTKYGPVKTDHILFIGAGAFSKVKPSDLIPELQGRFPIRVELKALSKEDLKLILTQPENALTKQYKALLETEGIELEFTDDAIEEIAFLAAKVNETMENIGARRLHTMMEQLLEEISFCADSLTGQKITIDASYVRKRLKNIVEDQDMRRFLL